MSDSLPQLWAFFWNFNAIKPSITEIKQFSMKLREYFAQSQFFCKRIFGTKQIINNEIRSYLEDFFAVSFNWALSGTDEAVDSLFQSNIRFTLQQHPEISNILIIAPKNQISWLKTAFSKIQIKDIQHFLDF